MSKIEPRSANWLKLSRRVTGSHVEVAYVDQGSTGDAAAEAAKEHGIRLEVVKLPETKRGFVLLPRRWVVERSFAWATRFRRLVRDDERLPATLGFLASGRLCLSHASSMDGHFQSLNPL